MQQIQSFENKQQTQSNMESDYNIGWKNATQTYTYILDDTDYIIIIKKMQVCMDEREGKKGGGSRTSLSDSVFPSHQLLFLHEQVGTNLACNKKE